ncbi:UpxY family transcription antiterminator [Sphingobacterium faecium]|uniref:UpxY family transcription antiterminator n=1 Tax=Sphingobacterium faecium TaxID=34087 RepID=UPI0032095B2D
MNINRFWYVIYTFASYEKKVERLLKKKNIDCFLPLRREVRQWSDRKKIICTPLFPNYIFVYSNTSERFDLLQIHGVSKFVSFEGKPVCISDEEINIIRMMSSADLVVEKKFVKQGDWIKVIHGPFRGLEGIVFEHRGKTRFGVRIESINQLLSIEICNSAIQKIQTPARINEKRLDSLVFHN